jgi:hypothetical protein
VGTTIVKIDRERDEYVLWSSYSEKPTWLGTREKLVAELTDGKCPHCGGSGVPGDSPQDRIARADLHGSSSTYGSWWWEYRGRPYRGVYCQRGLVTREQLPAIVRLLAAGADQDDERILALLTPFEAETSKVP